VKRYRGDERGDVIFRIMLEEAQARHAALASIAANSKETPEAEKDSGATPGAVAIARTPLKVGQITISPDGQRLAFVTSQRPNVRRRMKTSTSTSST
jgi:hypothetical protein